MEKTANRLKQLREKTGLNQSQLAKKIGISEQSISKYERGERKPKIDKLEALADFYGVTVSYLQGEDTVLKARDLFFEISILADLYPGLHDQLKAIEDHYGIGYGYENLKKDWSYEDDY